MSKYIYFIAIVFSASSCIEEFDLKLDEVEPRLVIEGLVENNSGPHYVRLTKSKVGDLIFKDNPNYREEILEIVEDAVVVIIDDFGQEEQLELIPKNPDVFRADLFENGGYYKTTNFIGVVGRTYHLKVTTKNGQIYEANDHMPIAPKLKSISAEVRVLEKDGQEYEVPIITYEEPEELGNMYLIQNSPYEIKKANFGNISNWEFEVLSDKNLKPGTISFFLDNGASTNDLGFYHYSEWSDIHVKMSSMSSNTYKYYKFLLEQFEQDGGAYKPTPASPLTNITNGGLGFFRASSVATALRPRLKE